MSVKRRTLLIAVFAATGLAYAVWPSSPRPLQVDAERLGRLRALRAEDKFLDLPGLKAAEERRRLEPLMNDLLDRLLRGIEAHPTDVWVIEQMDRTVDAFHLEDTEARERCIAYLERVFDIFGIPDDRGAFRKYLIFW